MMPEAAAPNWLDSRELAQRFGQRHHNMLASIDLIVARCPASATHIRFEKYPVTAGLGGIRYVRYALLDRLALALLAMFISPARCEMLFELLVDRNDGSAGPTN